MKAFGDCVDYGIIGEGEHTVAELAAVLEEAGNLNEVNGIIYRREGLYYKTAPRAEIGNLDELPYPDYEGLEYAEILKRTVNDPAALGRQRFGYISLSRSCPFGCTFCFHPSGTKYRRRSLKSAFDEIDYLMTKYQVENFYVEDELFVARKEDLTEFCQEITKRKVGFVIQLRVDMVDEEKLIMLRDAGCLSVSFGLESADDRILRSMNKRITVSQIEEALALCYKLGINIIGNFIFGDPAETLETYSRTMQWWYEHEKYPIWLHPIIAYPGSAIYKYACAKGIISDPVAFIKEGCPLINLTGMSDKEYRTMVTDIGMASKTSETIDDTEALYEGNNKACIKSRCLHCHRENTYRGVDVFRNTALLRCPHCYKQVYLIAADYMDMATVRDNISLLDKVCLWPMVNSVATVSRLLPEFIASDKVYFVDASPMKHHVNYKGKIIHSPKIIEEKRIDTVILMSSASFLVEDIMHSIRREHPSVQNVIFIGDLADAEFSLKKHNLLQQKE